LSRGGFDSEATTLEDVGVDPGGFDILVPEVFLNGADVAAFFQQMGGKTRAKCMRRYGFINPSRLSENPVSVIFSPQSVAMAPCNTRKDR
jgi:hypothetical protein